MFFFCYINSCIEKQRSMNSRLNSLARSSTVHAPSSIMTTPSMSISKTSTDSGSGTQSTIKLSEKRVSKVRPKPTLFSVLASQRFARQIAQKIYHKRAVRLSTDTVFSSGPPPVMEPTFRLEPTKPFSVSRIVAMLEPLLNERLDEFEYSPNLARWFARKLSDEIKNRIKRMNFERYKIVCIVNIGEKLDQSIKIASRCLWNDHIDTLASYTWQNESAFCCVTVFGIYFD